MSELHDLEVLFAKLKRDGIRFDLKKVGHGSYVIGTRSTYISEPNVFDFLHEVSHLIQFSDKELDMRYNIFNGNLIFNYPQSELAGVTYNDPHTDQMSMRELETFCIQYIIENTFFDKNLTFMEWMVKNHISDLFTWIPDDIIFGYKITHEQINKKAIPFLEKWDYDSILNRWFNLDLTAKEYEDE